MYHHTQMKEKKEMIIRHYNSNPSWDLYSKRKLLLYTYMSILGILNINDHAVKVGDDVKVADGKTASNSHVVVVKEKVKAS